MRESPSSAAVGSDPDPTASTNPAWQDVPHEDWCPAKNHADCCDSECECLRADVLDARSWARHGYEIGQRSCTWSDHGVAPSWLTGEHSPAALRGEAL